MILNEKLNFEDLNKDHQAAFINRSGYRPEKKLLPAGMILYKFNNDDQASFVDWNTKKPAMSPWWSPYEAYLWDAGWAQKEKIAKANGISVREWGRLTSAVKEDWNSLEYLVVIQLTVDVWGWFGGFTSMDRNTITKKDENGNAVEFAAAKQMSAGGLQEGKAKGSKRLPGGATQFYIPNLTPDMVAQPPQVKSLKFQ